MPINTFTDADLDTGRVDPAKLDSFTEADIERMALEDDLEALSVDVRAVRARLILTAADFAARFGSSARTLEQWEQGRRRPSGAALVLLKVIERDPEVVERALGRRPPHQAP